MNAGNENRGRGGRRGPRGRRGLGGWWLTPPRTGLQRLIHPWEYRHLRFYGVAHIAGAGVAAVAGFICLSYAVYGWAAFFLVIAALNIAGGCWDLTTPRATAALS